MYGADRLLPQSTMGKYGVRRKVLFRRNVPDERLSLAAFMGFAAAAMPLASEERRNAMSYLNQLKTEANYTRTLNGAKTHGTSGDACLDLFAVAGGMRYRKQGWTR